MSTNNGPSITRRPQKGNEAAADLPDLAGESPVDAVVMAHGAGHHQDIKCLAATQVHNASRPHRTTVCPARPCQPRRARKPWRARALAPICGRVGARGGRPFATAKAEHGRSGQGRELEAATISARRRPIVRGCGWIPKSTSLFSRPTRVRITAPALRAETGPRSAASCTVQVARACCCYVATKRLSCLAGFMPLFI